VGTFTDPNDDVRVINKILGIPVHQLENFKWDSGKNLQAIKFLTSGTIQLPAAGRHANLLSCATNAHTHTIQ
jgi:hypothetical protein